jgi:CubicO group peptidase (beta-lactamase class C family)
MIGLGTRREKAMAKFLSVLLTVGLSMTTLVAQSQTEARQALIARAKALELNTPYQPPPGDPMEHYASGYAKIMCSSVFITGLDPKFAAENVGYFTAPYKERAKLGTPQIDREKRMVHVTLPNGTVRTAKQVGSQGCVTLPIGRTDVFFKPSIVKSTLPDPKTQPWPMGDVLPADNPPAGIDQAKIQQAVEAAFDPAGMTAAFVVTYKGRIIAERYGEGITHTTPLESWSMGKSVSGTLMGVLIKQGAYDLKQPAPIPEWQSQGDPRAKIRIADILNMSSGLRIRAPQDPDFDPNGPYPDHLYLYTGSVDAFKYAATRPLQWPPNTVGRYRNTDPVLTNYLIRLAVEKRNEDYDSFPQRPLFDKIGIRTMVLDTDPYGNFLTHGYEQASARDWARLANLYLQDGVSNGERILPEGYVKFVRTLAPAWEADKRPIYGGGLFWLNGGGSFPAPKDAFYMSGVGGQNVLIVPSHQLVVVRLGHYKGVGPGSQALRKAVGILMEAVPATDGSSPKPGK